MPGGQQKMGCRENPISFAGFSIFPQNPFEFLGIMVGQESIHEAAEEFIESVWRRSGHSGFQMGIGGDCKSSSSTMCLRMQVVSWDRAWFSTR